MTTPRPPALPVDDDDDAFDAADDISPYIFSPDEIREDMARYISDPESNREDDNATSTGGYFMSVSTSNNPSTPDNPSTPPNDPGTPPNIPSTLSNDPSTPPNESPISPSLHLSLPSHFSTISLSTPNEERPPDDSIDHQEPLPSVNGNGYLIADEVHSPLSDEQEITLSSPPETPSKIHTPERNLSVSSIPITEGPASTEVDPSSYPLSAPATTSFSLPSIASNNDSPGLVEKPRSHRVHRSTGPSTFEKVISQTRPVFLPPKPKNEDSKHLADWHQMMKSSRLSAEKRRQALQERRLAREKIISDSLHIWEKEILPNWRVVYKNPELRKLWWRGIPTKLRAPLWENVVGNDLALSKDHYRSCLSRANRALTSGVFPQVTLDMIEEDMSTTLPALHIFVKETGPLYSDLKEILCAWVVSRSDEGLEYAFGAARIAAMLLINMPSQQQSFIVMRNLLERHCLRSFFGGERAKEDVDAYCRIFDTMLADGMPKSEKPSHNLLFTNIYFNFKQHQISPGAYLPGWIIPLFLDHLPFEACARIWDVLLLEGDSFLYRTSLGILGVLEPRLFFPEKKELMELLRGENKPAIEVAKREGRTLNGGKYEIYGLDEETLWERIDAMDGWWKDSTWTRLIQRELPDL